MTIETSFRGESVKSQLTWDCDKLRSIISDKNDHKNAREVISAITTFKDDLQEEKDKHYCRVRLHNVQ